MRQNIKKKERIEWKPVRSTKPRSYCWRKKNQYSISMKLSVSVVKKNSADLQREHPLKVYYKSFPVYCRWCTIHFKGKHTLLCCNIHLSMKLMALFTHHSPRCIRVWINSALSSLFCTEEEVRSKFHHQPRYFFSSVDSINAVCFRIIVFWTYLLVRTVDQNASGYGMEKDS